jgi:hypothetical protein
VRLRAELAQARAELEELRRQHGYLLDWLATATFDVNAPDGTLLASGRLIDQLLPPSITRPAPDVLPSQAPDLWAAWIAHRQRTQHHGKEPK